MKSKKGLILIVILLLLGGALTWQFVGKKKSKPAKTDRAKAPQAQTEPEAQPKETVPDGEEPVGEGDTPTPIAPEDLAPEDETEPGLDGEVPQDGEIAPSPEAPGGEIPRAQPGETESQPLIQVKMGEALRLAEGTTLYLENTQITYAGKRPLQYQWELVSGSSEKIDLQAKSEPKALITLGNLEAPEEFTLGLKVTDGLTETTEQIRITGFPAQLKMGSQVGGAFTGVQHMGDKWVVLRGQTLEIFSHDLKSLAQIPLPDSVIEYFATVDKSGKGSIFVQDPRGAWTLWQHDPVTAFHSTRLSMMGMKIHRVVPFVLEDQPYVFALLERNIELWNLSDPKKPRLKSALSTQLRNPRTMTYLGRNLFVADEDNIETIEFSTGQPVASVPSGGSVTALQTYSLDKKNFLMATIGKDRTTKGRQDYGIRIFEIAPGGRLGQERRITVGEGGPVEAAYVIPGTEQAMLKLTSGGEIHLGLYDLRREKLLPLNFAKAPNFISLAGFATGKIEDTPVALIADGNQLRVLKFQAQGSPPQSYQVQESQNIPGILSASWVQASSDGSNLWVGDEGTLAGGALARLQGPQLQITSTHNLPGVFPAAMAVATEQDLTAVLNLVEDPQAVPVGQAEGSLSLFAFSGETPGAPSKLVLGLKTEQGELRPLGVALRGDEAGLKVGIAISRVAGALGGAGLALWQKPKETTASAFLQQDFAKSMELIALPDARDVVFSQDGQGAFLASGTEGVIAVNLQTKNPVARMSLGSKDWFADRLLLAHNGKMLLASFINPANRQVIVKIFGILEKFQMQEYGTLTGLKAVETVEGLKAPGMALTQDDLYLFVPLGGNRLSAMNLSNPARPFEITSRELSGEIRDVALANKFKDVFVALGSLGVAQLEFGF